MYAVDLSRIHVSSPLKRTAPGEALEAALTVWAERRTGVAVGEGSHEAMTTALRSPGRPLDESVRRDLEPAFGRDLGDVRVHTDEAAARSADALGARAFAAGQDVVFGRGHYRPASHEGRWLLAHEVTHALQQEPRRSMTSLPLRLDARLEAEADAHAHAIGRGENGGPIGHTSAGVLPNLEEKILRFGVKWLSKRTMKTVSKHIAMHARAIAGKAVHSIFGSPKKIRALIELTLKEAAELAAKHPRSTGEALEEGGLKIMRQTTGTPGKFRVLVQKVFDKEIGTSGEKVLRVVLDQSGRLVTAFPAGRLAAIGIGVGGATLLETRTAEAAERVHARVEAAEAREEENKSWFDWEDFLPFIGDLWGGSLNEGEGEMIERDRMIAGMIAQIVDEVEAEEKRRLDPKEHAELEELVRAGIALPLLIEGDSDE